MLHVRFAPPPLTPAWLVARPFAHRGLHDRAAGLVENTIPAARAAVAARCAIECDVQVSADGEAMVFHDYTVERLTTGTGRVDALSAATLRALAMREGTGHIARLDEFCAAIAGETPLVVEIKSRYDGDMRLAARTAEVAAAYEGPLAIESFDPHVIAWLRLERDRLGISHVPLGIVGESRYEHPEWSFLTPADKHEMAGLLHWSATCPDFLSWCVDDLPDGAPSLARSGLGRPILAWTVRTAEQLAHCARVADQPVFEGVRPSFALT